MYLPVARVLTVSAMALCVGVAALVACTRTTERVVEPVGGGDASTAPPEATDASVTPIGPVARDKDMPYQEHAVDLRLVRSPELGQADADHHPSLREDERLDTESGLGGFSTAGYPGTGGSDRRPVIATGGSSP